jgi:pantothenate kinase
MDPITTQREIKKIYTPMTGQLKLHKSITEFLTHPLWRATQRSSTEKHRIGGILLAQLQKAFRGVI